MWNEMLYPREMQYTYIEAQNLRRCILVNVRINKDVNNYVQEIIQHLMAVEGADVELKLEVDVTAPNGIPNGTVRTVSENCRTLKVKEFGFDN